MSRENKKFHIVAVNHAGFQVEMSIVERNRELYLLDGLNMQKLSLPDDWKSKDIENEIKRVSGVTRLAITNCSGAQ